MLFRSADDTKVAHRIRSPADAERLQAAIDVLTGWAERWQMAFNVQKCKIMHVGRSNPRHEYTMLGHVLSTTEEEKDLGVLVTSNLKPAKQCARAAATASTVLGQITRAFHYRDRHVFARLYRTYVRPHLEYAVQAWAPWARGDVEKLERVQERAVRQISGLRGSTYEEKLDELGMLPLAERRHQLDMCSAYRVLTGKDDVQPEIWFTPATASGRETRQAAHVLNVRPRHGRLEVRANCYSVRTCEPWNRIPADIREKKTAAAFKAAYAAHRRQIGRAHV